MRAWVGALLVFAGVHVGGAGAQAVRPATAVRSLVRLDAVAATNSSVQLGAGLIVPAGTYLRTEWVAAAGAARVEDDTRMAGRVDGIVRFVIDPFAELNRAVHALGGVSGMYDGVEWQPRLVAGLGIEGRRRGAIRWSAEVAVGGGVRIGVAARRGRPDRR